MKSYRWLNDKKSAHPMQETQETWVRSLVQEDPLEEEMATHSSILAWKIPWTEETGGLQSVGSQSWRTERLSVHAPSPARRIQESTFSPLPLPLGTLREFPQSPPRATQDPWSCLPPSRTCFVSFPNSCRSHQPLPTHTPVRMTFFK